MKFFMLIGTGHGLDKKINSLYPSIVFGPFDSEVEEQQMMASLAKDGKARILEFDGIVKS